ncbi:MAG: hypothetical protein ABSG46_20385 [Candidatus Binataceae bacterium]|jgi:hypothetical protein
MSRFIKFAATVAAIGGLTGYGLMAASSAGAATAHASLAKPLVVEGAPAETTYLAGYATINEGDSHFYDFRSNISVPSQMASGVTPDSFAAGISQQDRENASGETDYTTALGWVWDDTSGDACGANTYTLEYGDGDSYAYVPLNGSDLRVVLVTDPDTDPTTQVPICNANPVDTYLELEYDATTHHLHFYEGTAYNNKTLIASCYVPSDGRSFNVLGVGLDTAVDGTNGAAALNSGTLASFGRARFTLSDGKIGKLQALNLEQFDGTEFGGAPSVSNPATLTTSGLVTGGISATGFHVVAP